MHILHDTLYVTLAPNNLSEELESFRPIVSNVKVHVTSR